MREHLIRYASYIFTGLILVGLGVGYAASPEFRMQLHEGWNLMLQGDQETMTAYFHDLGFWGPVFIILFMFLQIFAVVFPSWLLMVVAVLGYGPVWGTVISVAGITVAAVAAYWIGRGLGEKVLSNLLGDKTERKMDKFLNNYGTGAVALFRLSPFLSNDGISLVAGMLKMRFWNFLLGTLAGITPLAIALALFSGSPDKLKNGLVWIGGGGIVLYAIYIWLDRRTKADTDESET
jgi:uncharacterized membrane protein YdjX (TVP38/TMEM64 family)